MVYNRLILGTAGLGSRLGFNKAIQIIKEAANAGIYRFDTAPLYGCCQSQEILARVLQNQQNAEIYSKLLSIPTLSIPSIAKMLYRRSGYKAFSNLYEMWLLNQFIRRRLDEAEVKLLLSKFIRSQVNRYPQINFKGWFLHSPSIKDISIVKSAGLDSFFHCCGDNCIHAYSKNRIIQIHANSFSPASLGGMVNASEIWIHGIAKSDNPYFNVQLPLRYKKLLREDPRICVVAGCTSLFSLNLILDSYMAAL